MSKLRVTFKSPDAVDMALQQIQDEEKRDEAENVIRNYVQYGEYVTIEFDIETGEATVVGRKW